jgi:sugar diacid utilization regulator
MQPGNFAVTNAYEWLKEEEEQYNLICRLKEKEVSGMGIMLRYLGGDISEKMKRVANQLGFPIIALDDSLIYYDLMNSYNESIYISHLDRLIGKEDIQKQLIDCYQEDFYSCIMGKQHDFLGRGIYARFEDKDFFFGDRKTLETVNEAAKNLDSGNIEKPVLERFTETRYEVDVSDNTLIVLKYTHGADGYFYLLEDNGRQLRQDDFWIISLVCSLINTEIKRKKAIARKRKEQIVTRLLTSRFNNLVEAQSALGEEGMTIPHTVSVLSFSRRLSQEEICTVEGAIYSNCSSICLKELISGNYNQSFVLLVPVQTGKYIGSKDIGSSIKKIQASIDDLGIGQGNAVDFIRVKESLEQSRQALTWAKKMKGKRYLSYGDLGFLSLIKDEDTDASKEVFFGKYIEPLREYDALKDGEMIKTLVVLIENNWYPNQASKYLYVHHNTVKNRLEKIEKLLSLDLADPRNRLNLSIAIELAEKYNT